jgi:DNA-binding HxlR family transcriptional regulator
VDCDDRIGRDRAVAEDDRRTLEAGNPVSSVRRRILRFSELERAIPAASQKMLAQQLRQLEADGIVRRVVHAQVPPKVEYALTDWGESLCPSLDALLTWLVWKPASDAAVSAMGTSTSPPAEE